MKNKKEQIEEMEKVIQKIYITKISRNEYCLAQDIYEAGYRKASDVIDEFVERLKQDEESVKIGNEWKAVVRDVDIERIVAEMRQEVDNG